MPHAVDPSRPVLTVAQVARMHHTTGGAVHHWIRQGWVDAYQLPGRQWRIYADTAEYPRGRAGVVKRALVDDGIAWVLKDMQRTIELYGGPTSGLGAQIVRWRAGVLQWMETAAP